MTSDSSNLEELAQNHNTAPEVLRQLAFTSIALRRLVASNPSADATLLTELSKRIDNVTHQYIALNPNTPPSILIKLFARYPLEILKNPALDLLLLENPNLYEELYSSNTEVFEKYELPIFFLEWAIQSPNKQLRQKLAQSSITPISFLESLASDKDDHMRRLIAQRINIPIPTLETLSKDKSILVRKCVAENISTPSYILSYLATDFEFYVRRYVAANPNTTKEILKLLIKDKDSFICYNSAHRLLSLISASQNEDDTHYINMSQHIIKKFSPRFAKIIN